MPRALLQSSDFTYLGHYIVSDDTGSGLTFGHGLTHRYVSGQLRFLSMGYGGSVGADPVYEFHLGAGGYGSTLTSSQRTNTWSEIFSPALSGPNIGGGDAFNLYWDESKGGLWTAQCTDYPDDGGGPGSDAGVWRTSSVCFRVLESGGAISGFKGPYGFEDIGQRAIPGGVRVIPAGLQAMTGGHPYSYGCGNYTSRMAQGLVPSLGIFLLGGPDVTSYTNPTAAIDEADFDILADCRSGTTNADDWYEDGDDPTSYDRGRRVATVTNYYDAGDPRENPSTAPTDPPAAGAQWLSPAPDGIGRWVWGDTFDGTGVWIDGENKYGYVAVGSFASGKAYYASSTLHSDSRVAELQIFDPAHFGEVAASTREPWDLTPADTLDLTSTIVPVGYDLASGGMTKLVAGATFDASTGILWLWLPGVDTSTPYNNRLVAYSVDDSGGGDPGVGGPLGPHYFRLLTGG